MDVITIESDAFAQIMKKLKSLENKFINLKDKADNPLKDKWLDNQDVMQLLKVSKRTLHTYRAEKILPYAQVGNKIYYKAKDIEKFFKNNYHKVSRI